MKKKKTKSISGLTRTSKKDEGLTEHDRKCAQNLAVYLVRTKQIVRVPQVKVWARSFRDLRIKDAEPNDNVRKTVEWYLVRGTDKYTPVVHSADGFRRKYKAIRAAMIRNPLSTEE